MFEVGKLVARIELEGGQVFEARIKKAGDSVEDLKARSNRAAADMGRGMLVVGAAITSLVALAVSRYAEFDKAMSAVNATVGGSVKQQQALRDAAIEAGAKTVYSAKEAAQAENELGKAGISTANILGGGLGGSLALAAAGQIEVADAAETAATAMTQFRLSGDKIPHLADLLAAGAGKAQGGVSDLSMALKQGGLVAAQMGFSIEDTIGTLTAFASAGLLGSDAGTSFKTMLLSLANPSKEAAKAMKDYNIQAYDNNGVMVTSAQLAGQLEEGFKGKTNAERDAALATIFGSDAIRAANVLYTEGAKGIESWNEKVNDSGYAARQAAELQNNLSGDIEKLGGSFDSVLIKTGSAANDTLREMVQNLTNLVDWYGNLDEGTQQAALGIGIGLGALLLFGGGVLTVLPKIVEFRKSLRDLNTSFKGTGVAAGVAGVAISGILIVLGLIVQANADAAAKTEAYADTLDASTHKITNSTRELAKENLAVKQSWWFIESESGYDAAQKLGIGLDTVTDAALGNVDALEKFKAQTEVGAAGSKRLKDEMARTGLGLVDYTNAISTVTSAVAGESGSIDEAIRVAKQKADVDKGSADSNSQVAGSYTEVEDAVDGVITSVKDLVEEIDAANGKNLDAREAARGLKAAYDDFDETIKKNGKNLNKQGTDFDLTTAKGRENQEALDNIAEAALKSGDAILAAGGSESKWRDSLDKSRDSLLDRIHDLGIHGDKAERLADKILKIPTFTQAKVVLEASAAEKALQRFYDRWNGKTINLRATGSGQLGSGILTGDGGKKGKDTHDANGSIHRYYANGGRFNENHIAQISQAGVTRVWGEPETGGELYAPMSPAKRQRSLAIVEQAVNEWGYDLVKQGGAEKTVAQKSGRTVTFGDVVIQYPNTENPVQAGRELQQLVTAAASLGGED